MRVIKEILGREDKKAEKVKPVDNEIYDDDDGDKLTETTDDFESAEEMGMFEDLEE